MGSWALTDGAVYAKIRPSSLYSNVMQASVASSQASTPSLSEPDPAGQPRHSLASGSLQQIGTGLSQADMHWMLEVLRRSTRPATLTPSE